MSETPIDSSKRTWLIASGCAGAVGGVATAVPFVSTFQPSEKAKAAGAAVEVDISGLKTGEKVTVEWRGKPVWIIKRSPEQLAARARWQELVAHDEAVLIDGFELFDSFVAISERSGGLTRIRLLHADGETEYVAVDEPAYSIELGDNVWLGGGVIVCPGVTIGDNSVIGAGAVVTRDIPANVVAVGNPARVVREI